MKKHLLGVCFLALVSALPAFADYSSLSDFWYTAEKKNDGSFFFEVEPPKGSTQNNVLICLEISRYSDFMFIDKSFPMKYASTNDKYQCALQTSDIPRGTFFYRAAVYTTTGNSWQNFKVYNSASDQYCISKIENGIVQETEITTLPPDENTYSSVTVSLPKATELNIQPVWLRSGLNGNPLMPTTPPGINPLTRANKNYQIVGTLDNCYLSPYDSFSHGAIVENGIIYIGVGATANFHPSVTITSNKESKSDLPDRLMIYRYDLSTGQFLKPIRVKNENGKELDHTNYRIMPWLRKDSAGTPYFLCAPLYGSFEALYEYSTAAYTLDFSKITEGNGQYVEIKAQPTSSDEELRLSQTETDYVFGTVIGDIKSGNYKVWAMKYSRNISSVNTAESWTSNIKTWNVSGKSAANPIFHTIDSNPFTSKEEAFTSYTPKVYPVDDSHVYTHATPGLVTSNVNFNNYANYEPAFYEIDSSTKTATLKNKLSDAIKGLDIAPASDTKRMSGFPIITIGNATIAAYGHLSDNGEATAVQLIQIKDPTLGFEEGNIVPLWDLFKETGLSTSLFQALDMTFIPVEEWSGTEVARASDANLVGHLLVYAAGAGMGLYRITSEGDDSVNSIIQVNDKKNPIEITNNSIIVNSNVNSVDIIDMQGRTISHYDALDCGTYHMPDLVPGIYMLKTSTTTIKFAI